MAIKGIGSAVTAVIISKNDPSTSVEDGATGFYPGRMPNLILTRIKDEIQTASMSYGDMQTQTFQQRNSRKNRECFRFGLGAGQAWANFFTDDGEPIPFETTVHMEGGNTYHVIAERVMDMIHSNTIDEIGAEIWSRNTMTETQRKNFADLSSRLGGSNTSAATTATSPNNESEDATDPVSSTEAPTPPTVDSSDLPPGAAILSEPLPPVKMTLPKTARTGTGGTPRRGRGKTAAPDA